MASGGAATRSIFSRMAVTAPVISSTVSPRTRSAMSRPPICEGVASPDIMRSKPRAASSRLSAAPVATLAIRALNSSVTGASRLARGVLPAERATGMPARAVPGRGDVEEILQDEMAVLGGDAFRVKLHAVHRQPGVRETHHQAVVGLGGDVEFVRHGGALDHQRMITRRLERSIDAAEHAFTLVPDGGQLAVH